MNKYHQAFCPNCKAFRNFEDRSSRHGWEVFWKCRGCGHRITGTELAGAQIDYERHIAETKKMLRMGLEALQDMERKRMEFLSTLEILL